MTRAYVVRRNIYRVMMSHLGQKRPMGGVLTMSASHPIATTAAPRQPPPQGQTCRLVRDILPYLV